MKINIYIKLIFIFTIFCHKIFSQIISNAKFEKCLRVSENSISNCENRMILTIATSRGKIVETQVLNQISGINGETINFDGDITITVKHSEDPRYEFPFLSMQTKVNFCPREIQKYVTDLPFISLCQAGHNDPNPTCGWVFNEKNEKIPYSQGFCCKCNGIFSDENVRSGSSCGMFEFSSSAHCMKPSNVWYSVNNILPGILNIQISIEIKQDDRRLEFILSPSIPQQFIPKGNQSPFTVQATILGQLESLYRIPTFESNYALVPIEPTDDIYVKDRNKYTAIVPKSFVSLTGDECDKIGVSYMTFYSQSQKCNVVATSCLRNQICDLLESDTKRLSQGNRAMYFIGADQNTKIISKDNKEYLVYPITEGTQNTLITLEVDAGDIRVISNLSPGKIVEVFVHQFESLSGSGKMEIIIENLGSLKTSKIITAQCSENIHDIVPKQFIMEKKSITTIVLDLNTRTSNAEKHTCTIQLINEQSQIEDTSTISFNTTKTIVKTPVENDEEMRKTPESEQVSGGMDLGTFDFFGNSFSSIFEGFINSPILFGGVIVTIIITIIIIVIVAFIIILFFCVSTNSFPLFLSIFCSMTKSTFSILNIIGEQNNKFASNLNKARKNKKHKKKSQSESWSTKSDSETYSNSYSKKNKKIKRKYSSDSDSSKYYRQKKKESPQRKLKRRQNLEDSNLPIPSTSRKIKRNSPEKRENDDLTLNPKFTLHIKNSNNLRRNNQLYQENNFPISEDSNIIYSPRRPPPPPPRTTEHILQNIQNPQIQPNQNIQPMKQKPIFNSLIFLSSRNDLKIWSQENHLVYLSFCIGTKFYKEVLSKIINVGEANEDSFFSLCGFIVLNKEHIILEFRNYKTQYYQISNNMLTVTNPRIKINVDQIVVPQDFGFIHNNKTWGPVLNLGFNENQKLWEDMNSFLNQMINDQKD